jgi:Acetyltransferase (GNAT) family
MAPQESKQRPNFTYRKATLDDAGGISTIFEEVAPEIPVSVGTEDEQRRAVIVIGECIGTNESWVAVDADGTIVGFVLARLLPHKGPGLFLEYIGVGLNSRKCGVFTSLVAELKRKNVPLNATVLSGNQSGMANILVKKGFTKEETGAEETKLRWNPGAPSSQ